MNKDEQLARLLRLKRHEKPGEEYFEGFLHDFHAYQRKALATQSAASLWWERVGTGLSALRRPSTAWAAVGVYAAVMMLIYVWPAPNHGGNTTLVISPNPPPASNPSIVPAPMPGASQPWQTSIPAGQTINVSESPGLKPPAAGKRRTPDQPLELPGVIGPAVPPTPVQE
jgi:hypothetical protein